MIHSEMHQIQVVENEASDLNVFRDNIMRQYSESSRYLGRFVRIRVEKLLGLYLLSVENWHNQIKVSRFRNIFVT